MMNNSVDDFMSKLAQQQPRQKQDFQATKTRTLEKLFLNHHSNYGRYQVLPLDSCVSNYPFVTLFGTREVQIPRKNLTADGKENVYDAWIRLLPKEGYSVKEAGTGRIVSSLTAADEQLLGTALMLHDQLSQEVGAYDPATSRDPHVTSLVRKRHYTLFHAYCMNKWDLKDPRTPVKQNFSALFVLTAKGFVNSIMNNIEEKTMVEGGDQSWIPLIYNNHLSNRDGYLMFSVSLNGPGQQPGYTLSATHEYGRAASLSSVVIPDEDAALMQNPVESFLGWQAARSEETDPCMKRLFNAPLIQEAVDYMSSQLSAIRMAKASGMSVADAIKLTSEQALASQTPTNAYTGQATNDPILAKMAASENQQPVNAMVNPASVVEGNTNPFQTPPAAHIDPLSSAPTGAGVQGVPGFNNTFQKPDFASNFGGDNKPF